MKKELTLAQHQKELEKRINRAQKGLEKILKKEKLTLVAGIHKPTNTVLLELIPTELADARAEAIKNVQDELLTGIGDKIDVPVPTQQSEQPEEVKEDSNTDNPPQEPTV